MVAEKKKVNVLINYIFLLTLLFMVAEKKKVNVLNYIFLHTLLFMLAEKKKVNVLINYIFLLTLLFMVAEKSMVLRCLGMTLRMTFMCFSKSTPSTRSASSKTWHNEEEFKFIILFILYLFILYLFILYLFIEITREVK